MKKNNYIICTTQRSGSSLLCVLLRKTGIAGNAIKNMKKGVSGSELFVEPLLETYFPDLGKTPIEEIMQRAFELSATENGVGGFKLMWDHLEHILHVYKKEGYSSEYILERIFTKDVKILYLQRKNKVLQGISFLFCQHVHMWDNSKKSREKKKKLEKEFSDYAIYYTSKKLDKEDKSWQKLFKKRAIKHLPLAYEKYVKEKEKTIEKILAYIGLSRKKEIKVEVELVKQTSEKNKMYETRYKKNMRWYKRAIYQVIMWGHTVFILIVGKKGLNLRERNPRLYNALERTKSVVFFEML